MRSNCTATGIGAAIKATLAAEGHEVITIDTKVADIVADLCTAEGRQAAVDGEGKLKSMRGHWELEAAIQAIAPGSD